MPNLVPTQPWPDHEQFYLGLYEADVRWSAMLEIVRYLRKPPFESTLFAATSMFSLCIAQTRSIRWMDGMLRIEPSLKASEVTFEYFHGEPQRDLLRPDKTIKPWRTTSPATDAVPKLERILCKRLRWYRNIAS